MNFWLLKTDPTEYSFQQLLQAPRPMPWEGVRHPQSLKHLGSMRKGDHAFVYHTGIDKAIMGTVHVASDPYPDISNDDVRLLVIDVDKASALLHPVTLSVLRHDERFSTLMLLTHPNLSVVPVSADLFTSVVELGRAVA